MHTLLFPTTSLVLCAIGSLARLSPYLSYGNDSFEDASGPSVTKLYGANLEEWSSVSAIEDGSTRTLLPRASLEPSPLPPPSQTHELPPLPTPTIVRVGEPIRPYEAKTSVEHSVAVCNVQGCGVIFIFGIDYITGIKFRLGNYAPIELGIGQALANGLVLHISIFLPDLLGMDVVAELLANRLREDTPDLIWTWDSHLYPYIPPSLYITPTWLFIADQGSGFAVTRHPTILYSLPTNAITPNGTSSTYKRASFPAGSLHLNTTTSTSLSRTPVEQTPENRLSPPSVQPRSPMISAHWPSGRTTWLEQNIELGRYWEDGVVSSHLLNIQVSNVRDRGVIFLMSLRNGGLGMRATAVRFTFYRQRIIDNGINRARNFGGEMNYIVIILPRGSDPADCQQLADRLKTEFPTIEEDPVFVWYDIPHIDESTDPNAVQYYDFTLQWRNWSILRKTWTSNNLNQRGPEPDLSIVWWPGMPSDTAWTQELHEMLSN